MNAAVFLDRDGTLIKEVGYLSSLSQIEILPNVPEGLKPVSYTHLDVYKRQERKHPESPRFGQRKEFKDDRLYRNERG